MAIRRGRHCVYDTRYHLVWAPKYRKWVWQGAIRARVREVVCEIAAHHGFEMEELEVDKDHVHLFLSFPTAVLDQCGGRAAESGQRQGDSGRVSRGPEAVVGRRVMGGWLFCPDSGG